jgi:hypothetical protein
MRVSKLFFCSFVIALATWAAANSGTIRLSTFPSLAVADGRMPVTVTAEVRDSNGKFVPNGTSVLFEASSGQFRDPQVMTEGGYARATYIAGGIPGTTKITASALTFNVTNSIELDLVKDASMLSTANEYIDIRTPEYLMYSLDQSLLGAAAPNKGVRVKYHEIEIQADDIQINVSSYELKAKRAHLKMGQVEADFSDLYLTLNRRRGFGTTLHKRPETVLVPFGTLFRVINTGEMVERFGVVSITPGGVEAELDELPYDTFEFQELLESASSVSAKHATVFPNKEIQFQRAEIYIGDARIMKLPLFQVNLLGTTPLITDQILNVQNNQLSVNYPHYLELRPGLTSLLRFRTGDRYGSRTSSLDTSAYLDWETRWSKGDDMQGGFTVSGLARSDWGINARQYMRFGSRTTMFAQADSTAMRNVFGSGSINHQLDGAQLSLNGSKSIQLRGIQSDSESYSLALEKDPTKVGDLPMRLYYGVVASHNANSTVGFASSQDAYGPRARLQLLPVALDKKSSLTASFATSYLNGSNTRKGVSLQGTANVTYRLSRSASVVTTYDYIDDLYSSSYTGKQKVSLQGSYYGGRASFTFFGSKGIDSNRLTYFMDGTYKFSPIWKISGSYTFDRFLTNQYKDYTIGLVYTFGWRDFGLVYNARTRHFGIQVLGASFN